MHFLFLTVCPGAKGIYTDIKGRIDYPEGDSLYENNLDCNFTIKAPENVAIEFKFSEFDFEGNLVSQNIDWLKIYDANNKKIDEYAMDEKPPTEWRTIESNVLILRMKTDGSTSKKGFVMDWRFTL